MAGKGTGVRLLDLAPWAVLALACAVAFGFGWRAVRHTDWPYDLDQYRDVGIAQSMLDGDYPRDYLYAGEYLTYPPLTGACIAAAAWLGHLSPPKADVLLGPVLNLLAPLLFFLLAKSLFGRWCALFAVVAFLYGMPRADYGWVRATYSPWLFAPLLGQSFFYGALLLYVQGLRRRHWPWYVGFGLCSGLAFLAHPAPVLLLGPIVVCVTLWLYGSMRRDVRGKWLAGECGRLAVAVACGALAASPLLLVIVGRYGFHTVNHAPSQWIYEPLSLERLPALLARSWSIVGVGACAGVIAIVRMRGHAMARRVVLAWMGCAGAFLAYAYIWQFARQHGVSLPSLVPSYHFYLHFTGACALCFGCGMVFVLRKAWAAAGWVVRRGHVPNSARPLVFVSAALVLAVFWLRGYPRWHDLDEAPHFAYALHGAYPGAYAWIMEHTEPGDVFLCNDRVGMVAAAPAGRKVVAAPPLFTGQFVDHAACARDREAMFAALESGDKERFCRVARARGVGYVAIPAEEFGRMAAGSDAWLRLVFDSARLRIYAVQD